MCRAGILRAAGIQAGISSWCWHSRNWIQFWMVPPVPLWKTGEKEQTWKLQMLFLPLTSPIFQQQWECGCWELELQLLAPTEPTPQGRQRNRIQNQLQSLTGLCWENAPAQKRRGLCWKDETLEFQGQVWKAKRVVWVSAWLSAGSSSLGTVLRRSGSENSL